MEIPNHCVRHATPDTGCTACAVMFVGTSLSRHAVVEEQPESDPAENEDHE